MYRWFLFVRFWGYGLLGAELALSFFGVLTSRMSDYAMGAGFANVFMAMLWLPIGGVLSVVATALNWRVRADWWIVLPVALAAGASFLGGVVLAALLQVEALRFVLPLALPVAMTASLRLWQRRFGSRAASRTCHEAV